MIDPELKMQPPVDPWSVVCPRCAAPAGELCIALSSASREEKKFAHPVRIAAAREAAR